MPSNIFTNKSFIDIEKKEQFLKQKGKVLWFTGLSGSGKTTLARHLEKKLFENNKISYVIDGDNLRSGINNNLGFSDEDRIENIRRTAEIAKIIKDNCIIALVCLISPFEKERQNARKICENNFIEIFVKCELNECINRDIKGLYKKANSGIIKNFTGISSPYEEPINPEIIIDTKNNNVEDCISQIYNMLFFLREMC